MNPLHIYERIHMNIYICNTCIWTNSSPQYDRTHLQYIYIRIYIYEWIDFFCAKFFVHTSNKSNHAGKMIQKLNRIVSSGGETPLNRKPITSKNNIDKWYEKNLMITRWRTPSDTSLSDCCRSDGGSFQTNKLTTHKNLQKLHWIENQLPAKITSTVYNYMRKT